MTAIRTLFDPSRDINRSIEKVITYQASQEDRLRAEISEYWVTDGIEEQLEGLLEKMQAAMDTGGGHEVGVWVSGFYGSGKSSFTKYFGFAFDGHYVIDGQPFLKHLQNRVHRAKTKALLNTVASRFPAAVVMLDLASEQIAGQPRSAPPEAIKQSSRTRDTHWRSMRSLVSDHAARRVRATRSVHPAV